METIRSLLAWQRRAQGWRADLSAFGAGLVAALALPPLHAVPVLLAAIPWLLNLIGTAAGPRAAARRGWYFGFGLHTAGLYWITEAILFEAERFWWLVPLAVPAVAGVLAVFVAAAAGMARLATPGWQRGLALAGAWTLADLARQFVASGFPWNPLGSVWAIPGVLGDVLLQPASLIGTPGLTLITVALASLPCASRRARVLGAAVFLAWAGFGIARISQNPPAAPGVKIVLVQGNIPQGQKWSRQRALDIFQHYLELTRSALAALGPEADSAAVVWPETASPFLLASDTAAREAIAVAARNRPALIGGVRFGDDGRPYNSLFALSEAGTIVWLYDKWHLVPFGEYQPGWLPIGIQVVPGGGFGRGPGPRTLRLPGMPSVGPLICYEAIFPASIVESADRPEWLVNVTNDAWFGNSSGPRQHLAAARSRAVEEGLPLLRVANTGITAGFDAFGHELGRIGLHEAGTLVLPLPGALPATFFARFGLLVPGALALVCFITGVAIRGCGNEIRPLR